MFQLSRVICTAPSLIIADLPDKSLRWTSHKLHIDKKNKAIPVTGRGGL
jgi:hypothetical protein